MDYIKKLDELKTQFPTYKACRDAPEFEQCVVLLRSNGMQYDGISKILGSPSKKQIRKALLTWAPELIEIDVNNNKKESQRPTEEEWILGSYMKRTKRDTFDVDGELWTFTNEKGKIYYSDEKNNHMPFAQWDVVCRKQIINYIINENDL